MDGFSISKILLGLQKNQELYLKKIKNEQSNKINSFAPELNSSTSNLKQSPNLNLQNTQNLTQLNQNLHMNTLAGIDRVGFIKNLLGLPQQLGDILLTLQNPNKPIINGTLNIGNLNQNLIQNQKVLNELFNEQTIPQINPELALNALSKNIKPQADTIALMFSGMVSLPDISKLIIQNGKEAVSALIIAMASASKQGLSNEQIQDTLSIINSCISMAESNNPAQSLKSLMMLYLPWLPLNEGIGFDLEITPNSEDDDLNDSRLTVLIQTINFGNLKGIFTLTTSNSIDVLIFCSEDFPKDMLKKELSKDSSSHAMNSNIDVENIQSIKKENENQETKVNLSATNEMNPYLLLMAHSFIRNVIQIDNNANLGL